MTDLYLKFTDQATADAVLYHTATVRDYARELTEEEQALGADNFAIKHIKVANYANIDTLGVISKPTGETDAEGNPVMASLDGWHVNVRVVGEDATALEAFSVTPTLPVRVWA
jgi:hypothetical protein